MTKVLVSTNPADGGVVWQGEAAGKAAVDAAVARARAEFPGWAARPHEERCAILRKFAEVLQEQSEELAATIAREIGKPLWEARTEVAAMAGKVAVSIRAHQTRCAEFRGGPAITRFKPHGVVAVLGPFNFPGHLPNGHIVPALLAGNTVLFKPSELAPATAAATLACWRQAGLPAAALQLLQGGVETARALAASPAIDGLFFTGSAATGKALARQFADTPGRILALEMGGNNPLIVDTGNIADLPAAAKTTLESAFLSAGQRCTCARRLIVVESPSMGEFIDTLLAGAKDLRVDDPFADPQPFMGPLADAAFPGRVMAVQQQRLAAGAVALLEARALRPGTGFISPGIIDVTAIDPLPDEEVFGPLLQLIRVPDLDAAIAAANATRYGLAAGLLSDDEARYRSSWSRLRAGIINWNTPLTGASSAAPFGGVGDSGNLRPAAFLAADYCSYPVASIEAKRCER
jgi:succinylglutamic semialdehyde dehydrogenase